MIGGVSSTISGSSGWSAVHCHRRGVTARIAPSSAANTSQITTFSSAPIHQATDPDSLRVSAIDGITSTAATVTGHSKRFCIRAVRSSTVATFDSWAPPPSRSPAPPRAPPRTTGRHVRQPRVGQITGSERPSTPRRWRGRLPPGRPPASPRSPRRVMAWLLPGADDWDDPGPAKGSHKRLLLFATLLAGLIVPASAQAWTSNHFYSPSGNIECKYFPNGNAHFIACTTFNDHFVASIDSVGRPNSYRRDDGSWGFSRYASHYVLGYGQTYTATGGLRCHSSTAGMKCWSTWSRPRLPS